MERFKEEQKDEDDSAKRVGDNDLDMATAPVELPDADSEHLKAKQVEDLVAKCGCAGRQLNNAQRLTPQDDSCLCACPVPKLQWLVRVRQAKLSFCLVMPTYLSARPHVLGPCPPVASVGVGDGLFYQHFSDSFVHGLWPLVSVHPSHCSHS